MWLYPGIMAISHTGSTWRRFPVTKTFASKAMKFNEHGTWILMIAMEQQIRPTQVLYWNLIRLKRIWDQKIKPRYRRQRGYTCPASHSDENVSFDGKDDWIKISVFEILMVQMIDSKFPSSSAMQDIWTVRHLPFSHLPSTQGEQKWFFVWNKNWYKLFIRKIFQISYRVSGFCEVSEQ